MCFKINFYVSLGIAARGGESLLSNSMKSLFLYQLK